MKTKILSFIYLFVFLNTSAQELIKNIEPGAGSSYPTNLHPFKNKLIFWAYTNFNGYQMYITDGTSAGTIMLTNIPNTTPTNASPSTSIQDKFIQIDSLGFFYVITSTAGSTSITNLNIYRTDGTINGTYRLTIDNEITDNGLSTINFFKLNGMICTFVTGRNALNTAPEGKLFIYNPITRIHKLKPFLLGMGNTICKTYLDPRLNTWQGTKIPFTYNDKLFYIKGVNSDSLFSYDTTGIVFFKIKLPFNYFESLNHAERQIIVNNKLIYLPGPNLTNLPSTGREPYYYDFETNTTGLVKDINPYFNYDSGVQLFQYSYFNRTEEKLAYFFAYNPDYGTELYYTDGTPNGTNMTRDTKPGTADLCNLSCSAFYKGDTLILLDHNTDSFRVYYKNIYYQKFKKPTLSNPSSSNIRTYFSLGNQFYYTINTNGDAIYKLGSINPLDSMVCAIPSGSYDLFLKKDTCLYFSATSSSCIPNTTTGYELFKYCNVSIYSTPQTEINEMVFSNTKITAYPNPTTGKIKFINVNNSVLLEIYDITGKIILTDKKIMQEQEYDLSLINKGIYFYKITSKNKEISTGKLIIQ